MSGTSGMKMRVKTEELVTVSGEVESQIADMRQIFNEVGDIVNRSNSYWEGEGQNAYLRAYHSKMDAVDEALKRFSDNVTNLRIIAGIYTATEAAVVDAVNPLAEDVIV